MAPVATHTQTSPALDISPLPTISFSLLEKKDMSELNRLLNACTYQGFFYLDFKGSDRCSRLVQDKNEVLAVMKTYFEQPLKAKMVDNRGERTRGYMPVGTFTGVNTGSKDCFEHFALPRDELYNGTLKASEVLKRNEPLLKRYIDTCHYATIVMLSSLSDVLKVQGEDRFECNHTADKPSDTILAMLSYPEGGTTHNKHTDIGTLTILFSDQWGLQLVAPETGRWQYVEPRANEAIINVGDALRFLSGKKLNSCLHRVLPPGGDFPAVHRYSLAYLQRPPCDLVYKDTDGKEITAKEWHDRKYEIYAASHEEQNSNQVLTGGMENILQKAITV